MAHEQKVAPWQSSMFSTDFFFCLHITLLGHVSYISNEVQNHALPPLRPDAF